MKTVWTGSISFGLVNIPVRLYSTSEPKDTSFRLLHKADNIPIEQKRWCPEHGREVPWDEVVKGYEVGKNTYVPLDKDDLKSIKAHGQDTIDISQVIDSKQIDPVYFDSHYYLGPDSDKEKAYFLLREVLLSAHKSAIGRLVMREREYVCAISPYGRGMLLATMRYAHEVRDIGQVEFLESKPNLQAKEVELAQMLVSKLQKEKFDMTEFKDTYRDELKDLVKKKMKGHHIETPNVKVVKSEKNLLAALKASL